MEYEFMCIKCTLSDKEHFRSFEPFNVVLPFKEITFLKKGIFLFFFVVLKLNLYGKIKFCKDGKYFFFR